MSVPGPMLHILSDLWCEATVARHTVTTAAGLGLQPCAVPGTSTYHSTTCRCGMQNCTRLHLAHEAQHEVQHRQRGPTQPS
jgi:hypothetical protein